MALRLIDSRSESEKEYSNIVFYQETEPPYFLLKDNSGNELVIEYLPTIGRLWNYEEFDVFLMENPYRNKEKDVFDVYHESLHERIGWIFPITLLESSETQYIDYSNFDNYRFVAFRKLLSFDNKIVMKAQGNIYKLTDFYDESLVICTLHRPTIAKIQKFDFKKFTLSLYKDGYSFYEGELKAQSIPQKNSYFKSIPQKINRITLKDSGFDISSNPFFEYLFQDILLRSENHFVRFIFVYQIIEYFMEREFDILFEKQLANYQANAISKNDFRENINNSFKERFVINELFTNTPIDEELKTSFVTAFKALFDEIGYVYNISFADKLYDFRNMITHNTRIVATKSELIKLVEMYERIVLNLLINYKDKDTIVAHIAEEIIKVEDKVNEENTDSK